MAMFNSTPKGASENLVSGPSDLLGPHVVDAQVRQAISLCWMMLPEDKRNVTSLIGEFRRIVDRALKDVQEDARSFGLISN